MMPQFVNKTSTVVFLLVGCIVGVVGYLAYNKYCAKPAVTPAVNPDSQPETDDPAETEE